MMSSNDYFSKLNKLGEQTEKVEYTPKKVGRRKGVNYDDLPWENNYRRRNKNDKRKKLHRKLLKYPKSLDARIKKAIEDERFLGLDIKSENDIFVRAVEILLDKHE